MQLVLLEVPCQDGKLQLLKDVFLQVATDNRRVWIVPCTRIIKFTTHPGKMTATNLLVHTTQGIYQARMVAKEDARKLEDLLLRLQRRRAPRRK